MRWHFLFVIPLAVAATALAQDGERGKASWYGKGFHGKTTASGERFDKDELTAAHPSAPLGSVLEVTSPETGKTVEVEVNDRGPYKKGRAIDLSERAAEELGIKEKGVAPVVIRRTEAAEVVREKVDQQLEAEALVPAAPEATTKEVAETLRSRAEEEVKAATAAEATGEIEAETEIAAEGEGDKPATIAGEAPGTPEIGSGSSAPPPIAGAATPTSASGAGE